MGEVFAALNHDDVLHVCWFISNDIGNKIGSLAVSYPSDVAVVGEFGFFEELLYPVGVEFWVVCPVFCCGVYVEGVFVGVNVREAFFT